jgi:hypothetical protein
MRPRRPMTGSMQQRRYTPAFRAEAQIIHLVGPEVSGYPAAFRLQVVSEAIMRPWRGA